MSYDVSLHVDVDGNQVELFDGNYTSNVSPMWRHALGRPLADLHGTPASEAAGLLDSAVRRMEADPDFYAQWNPPNGWGDVDGATDFLRSIRDACSKYPSGVIDVFH